MDGGVFVKASQSTPRLLPSLSPPSAARTHEDEEEEEGGEQAAAVGRGHEPEQREGQRGEGHGEELRAGAGQDGEEEGENCGGRKTSPCTSFHPDSSCASSTVCTSL